MLQVFFKDSCLQTAGKKYFKRADLVAKETEEYLQKYGQQIKNEDEGPSKATVGLYCDFLYTTRFAQRLFFVADTASSSDNAESVVLPRNEVITRLRDRSEPILLFGESELDAFKRLRKCEISEPEINRVS